MSQAAKESLFDSSFATASSGISRNTTVFFVPYGKKNIVVRELNSLPVNYINNKL